MVNASYLPLFRLHHMQKKLVGLFIYLFITIMFVASYQQFIFSHADTENLFEPQLI